MQCQMFFNNLLFIINTVFQGFYSLNIYYRCYIVDNSPYFVLSVVNTLYFLNIKPVHRLRKIPNFFTIYGQFFSFFPPTENICLSHVVMSAGGGF